MTRSRRFRRAFPLCALLAVVVVCGAANGAGVDHGRNLWAGQWKTTTGGFALRLFLPEDLEIAKTESRRDRLYDRLPCKNGPQLYRGGFTGPSGAGKIMGCGTRTKLYGRWSSNSNPDGDNGSFTIAIVDTDPLRFEGTAKPDSGAPFKWSGEWSLHFEGDGCCIATTPSPPEPCRKPASTGGQLAGNCKLKITYEMPERFGQDNNDDELIDYMTQPAKIAPKKWRVSFTVDPGESCNILKSFAWTVDGKPAKFVVKRTDECLFEYRFPSEGVFAVALTAEDYRSQTRTASLQVNVQDWLIIGVGDSLSSGEGSPDIARTTGVREKWEDRRCHRSARSWQALFAKKLEDDDPQTSVTFVHQACSGATIPSGLLGGYAGIETGPSTALPPQVSESQRLIGGRKPDALMMTIGVNDLAFGSVISFCVKYPRCYNRTFENNKPLSASTVDRLATLPGLYRQLAQALQGFMSPERVFAMQYPNIIAKPGGGLCAEVADDAVPYVPGVDIGGSESAWLFNSFLIPLNGRVADAARDLGWNYIPGARERFAGHGYCASEAERWVVTYQGSLASQGNQDGTLHPNPAGHEAMAALAEQTVRAKLYPGGKARAGD